MKTVVLCGPMGAGKTAVARVLSEHLNAPLYDIDHEIERFAGKTIPEIFDQDGEPYFRQLETRIALGAMSGEGQRVVALGGGALESDPVWQRCLAADIHLIYLRVSSVEAVHRVTKDGPSRPLLAGDDPERRWLALLQRRSARYERADRVLDTDDRDIQDLVQTIADDLN